MGNEMTFMCGTTRSRPSVWLCGGGLLGVVEIVM